MKRIISILVCAILLPMLMVSCYSEEEYARRLCYIPEKLVFSKYGGEQIFEVPNCNWPGLTISTPPENRKDFDNPSVSDFYDGDYSYEATLDWLTVELDDVATQVRFIVAPNETGKKRKLNVSWRYDAPFAYIVVEQNK